MTKEQLKNILIENKCIATDEWSNENPFVGIELDALYDILAQEKQQMIEKACEWLKNNMAYYCGYTSVYEDTLIDKFKQAMEEQL